MRPDYLRNLTRLYKNYEKGTVKKFLTVLIYILCLSPLLYADDSYLWRRDFGLAVLPAILFFIAAFISHQRIISWSFWSSRKKTIAVIIMIIIELFWFFRIMG